MAVWKALTRDNSNFGIANSICKHGLKLCGSLLDHLGGAMIGWAVPLVDLNLTSVDLYLIHAWRCFNFRKRFFLCTNQ